MSLALLTMSHSPLLHKNEQDPPDEVKVAVEQALSDARRFVEDYSPELVISFAPDHYNGFFYDTMPPFCLGLDALAVGDYDSLAGPLDVPGELAHELAVAVQQADIDLTISRRMELDHGAVQPLELMFGSLTSVPVVPVFVNSVAAPFVPMARIRRLGQAMGSALAQLDQRVLLIGSGGLSHDPPVPRWTTAGGDTRAFLLNGRNPTPQARAARQQRVIDTAVQFARGQAAILDLNPTWDQEFMSICASGQVERFDQYIPDEMAAAAGNSSHEVRTWVAAFSALAAAGEYQISSAFYRAIPEYIAGFGVMTAATR